MTYLDFIQNKPVLYGSTIGNNGKQYIGSYSATFNKYTNNIAYAYVSAKGRMNKNMMFTIKRAFDLFQSGRLSTDPEKGNLDNYV